MQMIIIQKYAHTNTHISLSRMAYATYISVSRMAFTARQDKKEYFIMWIAVLGIFNYIRDCRVMWYDLISKFF